MHKFTKEETDFIIANYVEKGGLFCSEKLNIKNSKIISKANSLGLKVNKERISKTKSDFFKKLTSENPKSQEDRPVNANRFIDGFKDKDVAYISGLLWADGHVDNKSGKVVLGNISKDVLDFQKVFERTGRWYIYSKNSKKTNEQPQTVISCSNKLLASHFYNLGYGPGRLDMSNAINFFDSSVKHHWWRGFFDGDGCFYFDGKQYLRMASLTSCYDFNWKSLVDLLDILNIQYRYKQSIDKKLGHKRSTICFAGRDKLQKLGDYLYKDSIDCRLERKYNKWLECIK